jgi:hypothetical protein
MSYALVWIAPKIHRAFLVATNEADRKDKTTFEACDDVIGALIKWDTEHTK